MSCHAAEKWKSLIGLGFRAGKVITGTEAVWSVLKKKRAYLVVVAEDASVRTKAEFLRACEEIGIPCIVLSKKEVLASCTGQSPRAVLAITDQQMARAVLRVVRPEFSSANG
ncbi:MAG: L7Ae/L30e/S12e/Gadd45 family ribosomal protein [Bacillota bacterium]|jgi:ribosomal protein L7Ae-like RNA K-turn-binding protein